MTIARAHLVDSVVSRWYHCVTRCVRRAFLLGDKHQDRKSWIERRLQELADIFAISVGGFAILDITCTSLSGSTRRWARAGLTKKSSAAGDGSSRPATRPGRHCRSPRIGCRPGSKNPAGWPGRASGCRA